MNVNLESSKRARLYERIERDGRTARLEQRRRQIARQVELAGFLRVQDLLEKEATLLFGRVGLVWE